MYVIIKTHSYRYINLHFVRFMGISFSENILDRYTKIIHLVDACFGKSNYIQSYLILIHG